MTMRRKRIGRGRGRKGVGWGGVGGKFSALYVLHSLHPWEIRLLFGGLFLHGGKGGDRIRSKYKKLVCIGGVPP